MPAPLTEVTEIATALGMLVPSLEEAIDSGRPARLHHVPDAVWDRLVGLHGAGTHSAAFTAAFANGQAFLWADDGLRLRAPKLVEWHGPHRPPGDDVVPADLRVDHVFQVSCKYLSRITQNSGPARLFDRLLVGEDRTGGDWFDEVAPHHYQRFYGQMTRHVPAPLPDTVAELSRDDRLHIKRALSERRLPADLQPLWADLCHAVAEASAERWRTQLDTDRKRLRHLWRLCRIGDAPYFVLGTDRRSSLRLRVESAWDWVQNHELLALRIEARRAGQPEVGWHAEIVDRLNARRIDLHGHVEIRWSHGRFSGSPEAKVYLDTPHIEVPGYHRLG